MQPSKPPQEIANKAFEAIQKLYILPHPKPKGQIEMRMQDILLERDPTNPLG